jgi:phage-related protein
MTLQELQQEVDKRLEKLKAADLDAFMRCDAYIERFWWDPPTLAEFIEDYDKGVYS